MFIVIPLILSLSVHTMAPYSINIVTLSPEIVCVPQIDWVVENQQIAGDLPNMLPNMNEIIQLAKNDTTQLSSPPRIYATSGNSVNLWPDQPGAVETSYRTSGVQPPPGETSFSYSTPMTLRTLVELMDAGNYSIIFQSTWTEAGASQSHSWKFRVSADHQTTFIGEDGDALPPLRM